MCLIAQVPAGLRMPDDYVEHAYYRNPDGIGIMSSLGIQKFVGRKALRKATRYLKRVHEAKVAHAIHFRYATHGDITLRNCHPFELPNGNGFMMHNGVLGAYTAQSTKLDSDTAIFAREHTSAEASGESYLDYWSEVAGKIGFNKLVIMLPESRDFRFVLVNSRQGSERDGIWYSQTYSLPHKPFIYHSSYVPASSSSLTEGERWGKWVRARDPATGRWFYRLPKDNEFEPNTPPLLPAPLVDGEGYERRSLREALERQDDSSPWQAWMRDKHGNDPVASDEALDKELAKHLATNCVACFKADVPTDEDGICSDCLYKEAKELDKTGLLPGWSETTEADPAERYKGKCVDCLAPIHEDKSFCGDATGHNYCIGLGYEISGSAV